MILQSEKYSSYNMMPLSAPPSETAEAASAATAVKTHFYRSGSDDPDSPFCSDDYQAMERMVPRMCIACHLVIPRS